MDKTCLSVYAVMQLGTHPYTHTLAHMRTHCEVIPANTHNPNSRPANLHTRAHTLTHIKHIHTHSTTQPTQHGPNISSETQERFLRFASDYHFLHLDFLFDYLPTSWFLIVCLPTSWFLFGHWYTNSRARINCVITILLYIHICIIYSFVAHKLMISIGGLD